MKVLHIAAEAAPFVSTGGLGDAVGALAGEMAKKGMEVGVVMPLYRAIDAAYKNKMEPVGAVTVAVGWRRQPCEVYRLVYRDVPFYFIGNNYYFDRDGLYGHGDDCERYAFFCRAVLEALPLLDGMPEILHCHDWHAGMVGAFWRAMYRGEPSYCGLRVVFTLHDGRYQGVFPKETLTDILGLDWSYYSMDGVEYSGGVSFLKAGIQFADWVTTVSERHAAAIRSGRAREGMDGVLSAKGDRFCGIGGGIDDASYDPGADRTLAVMFNARSLKRRGANKAALQEAMGLDGAAQSLLAAVMAEEPALEALADGMETARELDVQLLVVGAKDALQKRLRKLARQYPGRVAAPARLTDALRRRVYAGADLLLASSPGAAEQMTAMRYGCVPMVGGGWGDVVEPYDAAAGTGDGFVMDGDVFASLRRALAIYRQKRVWNKVMRAAMKRECGWRRPVNQYRMLYRRLTAT